MRGPGPARSALATALVAVMAVAAAACGGGERDPEPVPDDPLLAEADRQREAWAGQDVESYRLTVERLCFCPPEYLGPFVSTVRDGSVTEVAYEATGEAVSDDVLTGLPVTVEELFDVIEEFADADSIEVRYDPDFGFPSAIEVDPMEMAVDEEVSYFVRGFEPQG